MTQYPIKLFLCPACNCYTVHMPRLARDGRWMVDHTLVERTFYKDVKVTVPYNWCLVTALDLVDSSNFTRTVIRV
jgi:hypothetical protein